MKNSKFKNIVRDHALRAGYLATRFGQETKGVAAIEFAFLAPLMLLMYVGTMEVSNAVSANRKLSRVSSTVGDLLTQTTCYTDATLTDIMKIADDIMFPFSDTLKIQINGVKVVGGVPKVQWSRGYYGALQLATGANYTVPDKIKVEGNFLVAAKIDMNYAPAIGWLTYGTGNNLNRDNSAITMKEEMFLRPRIGDTITLNACT